EQYDPNNGEALWGSYGYTADRDVARVPMTVSGESLSIDQLTFGFADVTKTGGKLVLWWGKTQAYVTFELTP
ncbi:MAG: DUF2911 domain-containing protein, partial [Planctomycetota bacterium]